MKRELILGNDFLQTSFLGRRPGWDKTHPPTLQSFGEAFGTQDWLFRRTACQEVHEPSDSEMPINKSFSSQDLRKDVKNASEVSGASVGATSRARTAEPQWAVGQVLALLSHQLRTVSHTSLREEAQSTPPHKGRLRQDLPSRSLEAPLKLLKPRLIRTAPVR